jgi:hypothetical protein
MADTNPPLTTAQTFFRWGLFCLALGVWTYLLLSARAPGAVATVVPADQRFLVAKTGHVAGYAVLAILVGFLPVRLSPRIAWWLFLVVHGGLTEYLQQFVPGRTASVRDVGLDVLGITLGLAVLLLWHRSRRQAGRA